MVAARIDEATPDLIPVPPEWMQAQDRQGAPSQNRNINDIYWRKPDGYITTGPSALPGVDGKPLTAQSDTKRRLGWTPLPFHYSYTNRVSTKTGQRDTIEINADKLNTPDRYYWLFANGGAKEFTIEQIVDFHWHIKPPYGLSKAVFPQLLEWDVPDPYYCPVCPGSKPPRNSEEQVVQHLMIEHRLNLPQVRDLAQTTDGFRDVPRGSAGIAIRRKAQAIERSVEQQAEVPSLDLPKSQFRICNNCGQQIEGTDNFARARHSKTCPAQPGAPSEQAGEEG